MINLDNYNYSVLMSVYYKEKAEYLLTSMESILQQTYPTNDFVLVCDGLLGDELNKVIEQMQERFGSILQVIRLQKNVGLGNALNYGMKYCKNDLIARMDSDDISRPDRCEKQLAIFKKFLDISIISGTVEEFSISPSIVDTRRVLPEQHEEIIKFAKKRNPFNHPCVMYKKKEVEMAGGYQDFYLLEDYYLWIRMLQNGSKAYNIQEPLLWMRAGNNMYKRRSGWKYAKSQIRLFHYMYQKHFISKKQQIQNSIIRVMSSMMPNTIRKILFKTLLRKKKWINLDE